MVLQEVNEDVELCVVAKNDIPETFNNSRFSRIQKFPVITSLLIVSQVSFFVSNCVYHSHSFARCLSPNHYDINFPDYFYNWMWWTRGCIGNDKREQIWRYASSPMSHYGGLHIANNLLLTLILGIDIEWIYGRKAIMFVWSSSCVIGIWTYQAWSNYMNRSTTKLVGSSGAVYGLIGCRVANLILNGDSMIKPEMVFRLFFIVLFFILDMVGYYLDEGSSTAFTCHWGGAVGGVLSGLIIFKNYQIKKYEIIVSRILIGFISFYSMITLIHTYNIKLNTC
jgi:membrane associated rhomboid family serine protease